MKLWFNFGDRGNSKNGAGVDECEGADDNTCQEPSSGWRQNPCSRAIEFF